MPRTTFYIRNNPNKRNDIINIRFTWGDQMFRQSLGISIPKDSFDKNRQMLRDLASVSTYRKDINNRLSDIKDFFDSYAQNKVINKHQLKKDFDNFLNPEPEIETTVCAFFDNFIKNVAPYQASVKTKRPVGKRSIQQYNTTLNYLNKYEKSKRVKLKFTDLDLAFHNRFLRFLEVDHRLCRNTIGGYVKVIKFITGQAKRKDIPISKETLSSEFYMPEEESFATYLNEAEIERIFNHDFSDRPRYEKVRDWLIIGIWTGMRFGDWRQIAKFEEDYVDIMPKKTMYTSKIKVSIPLHPQVRSVLEKRGVPQNTTDVEFNRVIKEVTKAVGITEQIYGSRRNPETNRKEVGMFPKYKLIGSHTCRRSFATNLYKSGFPTLEIMKITGHSTEKNFYKYIKITPSEARERLAKHWNV